MIYAVQYFQAILNSAFSLYFQQEIKNTSLRDISLQEGEQISALAGWALTWEEQIVFLLALMPHLNPQSLDLFFIQNKDLGKPYTEFGGWKGVSHSGFLPTGETAAFILTVDKPENRSLVMQLFSKEHRFYQQNVLSLTDRGVGEPLLSGKLCLSDEFLAKLQNNGSYRPNYSADFPAKRMETPLNWEDLVIPKHLTDELNIISKWLEHKQEICSSWNLNRLIKPGYCCLLYGPPGTGKTLTACLLGKKHNKEVYRVDLSRIVSKYIGETEKNLAKIFDQAENKNWILYFDGADTLFGKPSETNSFNNQNVNQQIAYLLQRIEDFSGMVILAANLKDNLDEAIFKRFQSVLYFPIPDESLRKQLWQQMIPKEWLVAASSDLLYEAAKHEISGGSMVNVIRRCAVDIFGLEKPILTIALLNKNINKELNKEV